MIKKSIMKIKIPNSLKITVSILMIVLFSGFINSDTSVYICKGKYSKIYHYIKNCRGLYNCSTDTYKVTTSKAKLLGRTLCGWED